MAVANPSYDDPRDGFRWREDRRGWPEHAPCASAPRDLFFLEDPDGTEPPYPTEEQISYCARCPVWHDCYEAGRDEPYGVWGGTTAYQRRALGRTMARRRCPVCSAPAVADLLQYQVCLGCGYSWRSRSRT